MSPKVAQRLHVHSVSSLDKPAPVLLAVPPPENAVAAVSREGFRRHLLDMSCAEFRDASAAHRHRTSTVVGRRANFLKNVTYLACARSLYKAKFTIHNQHQLTPLSGSGFN